MDVAVGVRAGVNAEEARAQLQARLIALSRMMFWSFLTLVAFLAAMYHAYPALQPRHNDIVFAVGALGLAVMAVIWRGSLLRGPLSLRALGRIDLVYAVGIGFGFAASAALAPDLEPAAYVSLIFAYLAVLSRALVVPSSGPRTTFVSALALTPLAIAAIVLSIHNDPGLPPGAFVGGSSLISVVVVVLATAGSRIIYGLRRQVSETAQLGKYTLGRKIGEGGMGSVFEARHELLRRPTAIKLLLPERVTPAELDRFELEVQHMSRLTHPNTVAVFDYGRSLDGVFYYAMEYLGGGIDLEKLVTQAGPQPAGRVIDILAQVCGALQESHDLGHIHRDIKPPNIILCQRGGLPDVAKVVDFGLVKQFTADTGESGQTVLGTPYYIAPEALTDPKSIGPAADLYALGAVGYFLLTGKRVFEGRTTIDIVVKHVKEAPVPPSRVAAIHIDAGLEALIMACLAKRPADRPSSAAALADALRALPAPRDWSAAEARGWWREYAAAEAARAAVSPAQVTSTITVDLGQRDAGT